MPLSYKEVAEIIKIIDASECEEVILELEGARLVIRRGGGATQAPAEPRQSSGQASAQTPPQASSQTAPQASSPAPSQSAGKDAASTPTSAEADGDIVVRAPMVGTFYRRPSPDQPAFVEEGGTVKAGDPICLIEVMKLYTTIEATGDGTVVSIAAEDGEMVEFNQPLFTIRPA